MRISDWSSDVCSSDLPPSRVAARPATSARRESDRQNRAVAPAPRDGCELRRRPCVQPPGCAGPDSWTARTQATNRASTATTTSPTERTCLKRSEEHTSELQSLMCISYAVFCLKKKKKRKSIGQPQVHRQKHTK